MRQIELVVGRMAPLADAAWDEAVRRIDTPAEE
jgi:hypothetical protein